MLMMRSFSSHASFAAPMLLCVALSGHIGNKVSNAQWETRTAGSRDLATLISFLVTCVQPEMLHISLHYEWMHLRPAYLTPQLIRLQITR